MSCSASCAAVIWTPAFHHFEFTAETDHRCQHLVRWYDDRQADFHEIYRVRVKGESFFSMVKGVAEGFCWSRGRPRKDKAGKRITNSREVCVAWINETLCKVIYVNLRLTVKQEIATGYRMNYLADTFFPPILEAKKLIA